jgi:hypothetical protein
LGRANEKLQINFTTYILQNKTHRMNIAPRKR